MNGSSLKMHNKPTEGILMFKGLRGRFGSFKEKAEAELEREIPQLEVAQPFSEKGKKLKEKKMEDIFWDLEIGLLESDVALPVVEDIKTALLEEIIGLKITKGLDASLAVELALKNAMRKVLTFSHFDFEKYLREQPKPITLMFVGVNGTGKTTAIARMIYYLKKRKITSVVAAADTFRAGAIEQMEIHCTKLGVRMIKHQAGSDPAAVAFDAVEHAKARNKDVVLIDTAGRMQTNVNLMAEMKKIKRVSNPDLVIFVGDSLAGNDAVIQAEKFHEAVGLDGVILTKIDADAKGGAALSIAHTLHKPVLFIGVGQGYKDFIPFDPDWLISKLLD